MLHPLETELRYRIKQDRYTTAYPWRPEYWAEYVRSGALTFKQNGQMSFYIHIPFCKSLCRFCEYTRCLIPDDAVQHNYLQIVQRDVRKFLSKYPDITLEGFDIGGGTPTSLSPTNFAYLMQVYQEIIQQVSIADDYEPSIEASLTTITPDKVEMIGEAGIQRLSIGIQSSQFRRFHSAVGWVHPEIKQLVETMKMIRRCGHFKVNLDFMYGFKDISVYNPMDDKYIIDVLNPDQVTVYELRTNQRNDVELDSPHARNTGYTYWYDILTERGYIGNYGRNTFSIDRNDLGLSSYLRHRMFEGHDYKGFGISAQSMSDGNVEYNVGKNHPDIRSLIPNSKIPQEISFDATEHYDLTNEEKFAKFVCVSGYSGGFDWRIAEKRYMSDFFQRFDDLLDFLIEGNYIEITSNRIQLTKKGFSNYGPILSLFYQPKSLTGK